MPPLKFSSARSSSIGISSAVASCQQAIANGLAVVVGRQLPAQRLGIGALLRQVGIDFDLSAQIEVNDGVNVLQIEHRVVQHNLLRGRAGIVSRDNSVQRHSRRTNPYDAVGIGVQWKRWCLKRE